MKSKKIILPILGIAAIASTAAPLVSCGQSSQAEQWDEHFVKPTTQEMQQTVTAGTTRVSYKITLKEN